ncbi:hypothetical protein J3458_020037 [Metarhizium acridum]|uniref:uncharacterized protein n=1 Tax=Metarhizium acridum TaxID=92637 RepID=UPI001C6C24C8|nr:hypothetical protein J3458_020037 [Metarhizium acridum]
MRFTTTIAAGAVFLARAAWARPVELAARPSMQERAAAGGGGLATILADHVKYVANPASAKDPITPASENNPAREAHRSVHAALFDVVSGGGGQKGAGAGAGDAAGPDADGAGKDKAAGGKGSKEQ